MQLSFKEKAIRQLEALPQDVRKRILLKLAWYAQQPKPLSFAKHLSGYDVYRFRIGHHRVFFDVEENTIIVLIVVGREGAYKNL